MFLLAQPTDVKKSSILYYSILFYSILFYSRINRLKPLGLHVDSLLSFNAHMDEICCNVGRKLNAFKARLSKTLSTECKLLLVYFFIAAQFKYGAVVWHFCSRKKKKNQKQKNKHWSTYSVILTGRMRTTVVMTYPFCCVNVPVTICQEPNSKTIN